MKIRMQQRLFLAILTTAALAVICMLLIMKWSFGRGFLEYVNTTKQDRISAALVEAYKEQGNWDFLDEDKAQWPENLKQIMQVSEEEPQLLLLDEKLEPLYGNIGVKKEDKLAPLKHNDRIISYLLIPPQEQLSNAHQLGFVKQQELAMLLITAIILFLSIFFSLIVARRLVRPINTLAKGIHRLSSGDYTVRVPVVSSDELGRLAGDFNTLALALEHNEKSRQQWVADISHELRTPLVYSTWRN
jgi:two-component system, OmpR family, sensor histidine kinase BaeS